MRSFCRRSMMTTSTSLMPSCHVVEDAHAHLLHVARHSVCGPITRTSGTPSVVSAWMSRARHARVQDVADDRHREVGEVLLVVADGVHVEQALRRVRVAAVAGVDHVHVRVRSRAARSGRARPTALWRTTNMSACIADRLCDGVEQRLALGCRGRGDVRG